MQEIGENVDSELDRIEGRRFILRMLGLSVESYIEGWDADAPHFRQAVSDIRKVFADSPDTGAVVFYNCKHSSKQAKC